jgi:trk system potassium uptake protein TrkH
LTTRAAPRIRLPANPWRNFRPAGTPAWRRLTTPQLFVTSFAVLIGLGTVALRALPQLYVGERPGWLDALFMAASAVCVTGLTVIDPSTAFTFAGQALLLVLIQLGGLGMIAFTTIIILALGRRPSLRQEHVYSRAVEVAPHVDRERLVRDVVRFTLAFEVAGALLLYVLWVPTFGWRGAAWPAVFHAVSAFCNAGFSTFSDSLIGFQRSPLTLGVVMALVVAGGIGFLTLEELQLWGRRRSGRHTFRLSVHSRLALVATVVLLAGGWLFFAVLEWGGVLRDLPAGGKLANALFMSVTPRSAGFATIDYSQAADSTTFLTIILMFVGGSPGSTAGGLKTTTVALLVLLAAARLRGRVTPSAWSRSIPEETMQRAVGLAVTAFALVTASIFVLTVSERQSAASVRGDGFLAHMFEAVSAFNTVGLSLGVTPELSGPGQMLSIVLMFVGRVGPLTFAAALAMAARRRRDRFHFAREDVIVG